MAENRQVYSGPGLLMLVIAVLTVVQYPVTGLAAPGASLLLCVH
jgi:hypothetical protein